MYNAAFSQQYGDMLEGASCYVAMHPDQATCDVVDAALKRERPFAVVPCCVYSHLFPLRRLNSGVFVSTYEHLLTFIEEKDDRICRAYLPFQGRNCVLFFSP